MKKNKQNYVAPGLTVVEFRVEKGYAASNLSVFSAQQHIQMFLENQTELDMGNDGNLAAGYMEGGMEDHTDAYSGSGWEYQNGGWF